MLKKANNYGEGVIENVKKSMRFQIVHELKNKYKVALLCEILKVSVPGYYKWSKNLNNPSERKLEDEKLKVIIKAEFDAVKGIYGYRRITAVLRSKYGMIINNKKVRRLMKEMGLLSKIRKKKFKYKNPQDLAGGRIAENLLNRKFQSSKPKTKLTTDITYLKFNNNTKTLYLSVIKDLFNNEILSYKISEHLDLGFVLDTVSDAHKSFAQSSDKVILHSDQGCHYTSKMYQKLLRKLNIKCSMSRRGNCYDNASQESFFSHLKTELFYFKGLKTKDEVEKAVQKYIIFYNCTRMQKKLGDKSPVKYRLQIA